MIQGRLEGLSRSFTNGILIALINGAFLVLAPWVQANAKRRGPIRLRPPSRTRRHRAQRHRADSADDARRIAQRTGIPPRGRALPRTSTGDTRDTAETPTSKLAQTQQHQPTDKRQQPEHQR